MDISCQIDHSDIESYDTTHEGYEKYRHRLISESCKKEVWKGKCNDTKQYMDSKDLWWDEEKIYDMSKYRHITDQKMEPHRISEKHRIPIKSKYIPTKKEKYQKKDIEMEGKITSHISLYGKCKDIDPSISEDEWDEYGLLWGDRDFLIFFLYHMRWGFYFFLREK
jgi:hypothetical protein